MLPLLPRPYQWRSLNWTCSLEFVPMPCSRIARDFTVEKPACDQSTDERMIENGSASTTWSAVTCLEDPPCLNVNRYVLSVFSLIATSSLPRETCEPSACVSRVGTWSLPPRTWYFSLDLPKIRRLPGPA